ncbi:phage tail protein I [Sulfitobacter delicatus]|uniref:Phage tail protein, P2 protein I family n=1 Tax=Sulfitobacter delicatus TaxID=218672 RepID=A0A1G7SAK3_9RHOB|nr:phage tail protein I [Sulfitobacter delicatus]SDG19210.1 phage tail protein, P2 protein I family [Sulfitobacter delicatus]
MSDINRLLPPSATTSERAIETVIAERTIGIEAPIATLWNVDTCPEALLPWMAWAFSVEVWDHAWPETIKRNVIRNSIQVHRMKGTPGSVRRAVESILDDIEIIERAGDLAPHEFKVVVSGSLPSDHAYSSVLKVIANTKPVRSHLKSIQVKRNGRAEFAIGTAHQHALTTQVGLRFAPALAPRRPRFATAQHVSSTLRIAPSRIALNIPDAPAIAASALHRASTTTIHPMRA